MKIILENELEKWAWEIMMAAHYKWEKNHGMLLLDQMNWYFEDIYGKEREKIIKQEVERRLLDDFDEEFFATEDEYVKSGLEKYTDDFFEGANEEKQDFERDLRKEYRVAQEDIADARDYLPDDVKDELRQIYYTFFNAPEKLTVIYNGEVIQESN